MPSNSLRLDAIRPATASLFSLLAPCPQLSRFVLMGGTAIALHIGHRQSNDLDFAVLGDSLPTADIDSLVAELKTLGMPIQLITDSNQITSFRIATGKRLLNYARDYMFADTKVTFFAVGAKQTPAFVRYLQQTRHWRADEVAFGILGLDGLKTSKAVVIGQRIRSRDLYDLFVLSREHGYSIKQLLADARAYGTNDDPEYYKSVLRGDIPLDHDDEGLAPVGVQASLAQIYDYFNAEISRLEVEEAACIARSEWPGVGQTN